VWKGKKMKKKKPYILFTLFKLVKTLLVFRTKGSLKKQMKKKTHKHPQERKLKVPPESEKKKMEKDGKMVR